jgi:DNA-binding response OmpR family regulator/methyl-accepting chemotaxis protein
MRILVVEDDTNLNRQLKEALTEAGYAVDVAFDGEEGHFLGDTEPYDAIVLDIGLPQMDGLSVLEEWRRAGKTTPVLLLTARDRWSDKVQGIDAGADDYVAKPFHMEEVLARIRALVRRAAGLASNEIVAGSVRLDARSGKVTVGGQSVKLTSHELRLLSYLMHHKGKVVSRTELTEHLYDQDFDRDSNTIEVFVGRLRKKLPETVIHTVRGLATRSSRTEDTMRKGSIAFSLFWLSAAWLILALVGTAFLLTDLYSRALDSNLISQLRFNVDTIVSATLDSRDPNFADIVVPDSRFNRASTGWYWVIREDGGQILSTSGSAVGTLMPQIEGPFDAENYRSAILVDEAGNRLRAIERATTSNQRPLHIMVTGNLDDILRSAGDFRGQTLIVLGAVGVALAIMSGIVARLALRPIGRLGTAIEKVREGEAETITGSYPREIAPLAEEVNELLRSNTQIIERARNAVGNLAHGLKTPLAVMRNEASAARDNPLAKVVRSESDKMTQLVTTYLDRARIAARTSVVGKKADATTTMLRLVRVMEKLNKSVTIAFKRPDASLPWFRGDEGDLEEMAGNLLDNACKWSGGVVAVTMFAERTPSQQFLLIRIEDDGPGLTEEEAQKVLRRGVRLDEKTPGSGLGLDIVKELVDVYGGSLQLKRSVLGGVLAELKLPAAKVGGLARS